MPEKLRLLVALPPTGVEQYIGETLPSELESRFASILQRLANAAREGRLQIALDVLETEPLPPDSPLRDLPNVTITPHIAGPTIDHRRACGRRAIDQLIRFSQDLPLDSLITPTLFNRST
ncbi:hypothetical protein BH10PLA1_BH10PLA1_05640 [soil metagenome]